ncbi:VOC family protein [Bacillus sp. Marseille-Q3570]|uniref:VOC family protein n=1 Tax=Bacillus sp. Marseille-Q3570 TaxID=2963522 RepID=UPI0021B7E154|nr:VOC family protein [Bacillus sp. Marseille-Q3570]
MTFHHVAIETNRMERAVRFYEKLGFKYESEIELLGEKIIFLQLNGFRLELVLVDESLKLTSNKHIAFEVENLDAMLEKNPEFTLYEGPYSFENGWKSAFILGPSGEIIELLQTN